MNRLTRLDKRILNRLQEDIDFVKMPWKAMAKDLGMSERFLLQRIKALNKRGLIRRISATFNAKKIGFVSTLVALKVGSKNIDKVAQRINAYKEVTHNYRRNSEYNLWFTLVAKNKKVLSCIISRIKKYKDIVSILDLPVIRLFKIDVRLPVEKAV